MGLDGCGCPVGTGVGAVLVEKIASIPLSRSLLRVVAAGTLTMGLPGKTAGKIPIKEMGRTQLLKALRTTATPST